MNCDCCLFFPTVFEVDNDVFATTFDVENGTFETEFDEMYFRDNAENYMGEYKVRPKISQTQVLETANKVLKENVVVGEIPLSTVDNATGTSFIIG